MATRTKARRTPASPEERAEAAQKLNEELAEAVEALATSDGWRRWITMAAKLPTYSVRNQIWLAIQAWERGEVITRCAGYEAWQKLGRQVSKGNRAYQVVAPIKRRLTLEEAHAAVKDGRKGFDDQGRPVQAIFGWRRARVFAIEQTTVVDPDKWAEAPEMADVSTEAPAGLWDAMVELIEAEGYELDDHEPTEEDGGALAWVNHETHVIWIRPDEGMTTGERCRRLLHEIAHFRLEHGRRQVSRSQRETEADSVAYIAGTLLGLDLTESTVTYLAGWLPTETEDRQAMLAEVAGIVMETAQEIVAELYEPSE